MKKVEKKNKFNNFFQFVFFKLLYRVVFFYDKNSKKYVKNIKNIYN